MRAFEFDHRLIDSYAHFSRSFSIIRSEDLKAEIDRQYDAGRFNAKGPEGLIDGKAPGPQTKLNDAQRLALKEIVEAGPIPAVHGVVRWRLIDLVQWLYEEFAISLDETTVGRELKAMGFRKLSARPRHHAQNEFAVEAFKKTSLPSWRRSGRSSLRA